MMVNMTMMVMLMIMMVMMGPPAPPAEYLVFKRGGGGGYRLPPTNHKLTRNIWKSDRTISNYREVDFENQIK